MDPVRLVSAQVLEDSGYEPVEAIDGPAALDLLEATPPAWFAGFGSDTARPPDLTELRFRE